MELVYLWVEDYKNIHRQGFNFSPRFECKFYDEYETYIDENGQKKERLKDNCKLVICDKRKGECLDKENSKCKPCEDNYYIENFFGKNLNITAIVGKNGSGKSSVLELVKLIITHNYSHYKMLFFCKKQKKIYTYSNSNKKIIDIISHTEDKFNTYLFMNQEMELYSFKNDQIKEIFSYSTPLDDIHLETINLNLIKYASLSQNFILKYFFKKKSLNIEKSFFSPDKFVLKLNKSFLLEKITKLLSYYTSDPYNDIKRYVENCLEKTYNLKVYNRLYILLKKIGNNPQNKISHLIKKCYYKKTTPTINELDKYLIKEQPLLEMMDKNLLLELFYIKDKSDVFTNLLSNNLTKFIFSELYYINLFESKSLKQFKNLSSGERNILLLKAILIFYITNNKPILVLLDEIESFFHPKWAKQTISLLYKELEKFNIHLILATHSPFILSDIPKQNIIFLDTDKDGKCKVVDGLKEKKQTFGANIHTLLSDSFFMEDGLMGEFAKSKINEIIDFHKIVSKNRHKQCLKNIYLKSKKEKFWQTQSIIGEDYLKQIVKNHLIEIEKILLGKDKTKEEEIKRVKEYLKSLEND